MSVRSEFFGEEWLQKKITEDEAALKQARSELENDKQLKEELNGPESVNEQWAGGNHRELIEQSIRLAGLKHAAGCDVADVMKHFREAGEAFLRIAKLSDFRVKVSEPFLDPARRAAKRYGHLVGVKVETFVDAKGTKLACVHSPRQPASLIFTRSLEAALLSGKYKLAVDIAQAYPLWTQDDGSILRLFVLDQDQEAAEHAKIAENWVTGDKDGDWPYPRGQFPKAIIKRDDALLAEGIFQAGRAFTSRWKLARYQTPAMVKRMKTKENAHQKAKEFLIDKGWLLYTHGLSYSVVVAHRGVRGFLSKKDAFNEWIPRELIIAGAN